MTEAAIRQIIEAKRELHPELAGPITWDAMRRILAREGVFVASVPLARPAMLLGHEGIWLVLLNKAQPRHHTYYAAHELGHLWLHVDRGEGRDERCYHMDCDWRADPREDDAELFAACLLGGPRWF